MRKEKPSRTAYKVALNILTLGSKKGMEDVLPAGIVDSTAKLLLASGAASSTIVRWSRSPKMVSIYEAFDWMLPGQFETFSIEFQNQVRLDLVEMQNQNEMKNGRKKSILNHCLFLEGSEHKHCLELRSTIYH